MAELFVIVIVPVVPEYIDLSRQGLELRKTNVKRTLECLSKHNWFLIAWPALRLRPLCFTARGSVLQARPRHPQRQHVCRFSAPQDGGKTQRSFRTLQAFAHGFLVLWKADAREECLFPQIFASCARACK